MDDFLVADATATATLGAPANAEACQRVANQLGERVSVGKTLGPGGFSSDNTSPPDDGGIECGLTFFCRGS